MGLVLLNVDSSIIFQLMVMMMNNVISSLLEKCLVDKKISLSDSSLAAKDLFCQFIKGTLGGGYGNFLWLLLLWL